MRHSLPPCSPGPCDGRPAPLLHPDLNEHRNGNNSNEELVLVHFALQRNLPLCFGIVDVALDEYSLNFIVHVGALNNLALLEEGGELHKRYGRSPPCIRTHRRNMLENLCEGLIVFNEEFPDFDLLLHVGDNTLKRHSVRHVSPLFQHELLVALLVLELVLHLLPHFEYLHGCLPEFLLLCHLLKHEPVLLNLVSSVMDHLCPGLSLLFRNIEGNKGPTRKLGGPDLVDPNLVYQLNIDLVVAVKALPTAVAYQVFRVVKLVRDLLKRFSVCVVQQVTIGVLLR
mmetsp:Transcript_9988/g.20390  ORF Transcript_9988/g.20390 Transcript_9988/m.20390 type:complete len:284 (-) Transcript_9988:313-1164(-)